MIKELPDDILWYLSDFLNVSDTLKIDNCFVDYYNPYVKKIQKWYRKYKEKRDLRYSILKNEFQIRNEKMYTAFYSNIFFCLYNLKKNRKKFEEYHYFCILKYFYKDEDFTEISELYNYTLNNYSYTNLKIFLRKLKINCILRL